MTPTTMTPQELIDILLQSTEEMTEPVYRGHTNDKWPLHSGAIRRLTDVYDDLHLRETGHINNLLSEYHYNNLLLPIETIETRDKRVIAKPSDEIERLSHLQHLGAATGLLDFTRNPLVALWFACEDSHRNNNHRGQIFAIDIGNPLTAVNARLSESRLVLSDSIDSYPITYYIPSRSISPRIIAQQSVLLFCHPNMKENQWKSTPVPEATKPLMREYLEQLGISTSFLFGDEEGLARANAPEIPLRDTLRTLDYYLKRGHDAFRKQQYDGAYRAYKNYKASSFGSLQKAKGSVFMGYALSASKMYDKATKQYTIALGDLHRSEKKWRRICFFNRGNMYAALGKHLNAILDYDKTIEISNGEIGNGINRVVLKNRGNSHLFLQNFGAAYGDFEKASSEYDGSDVALAMGNCQIMMGDLKGAYSRFVHGENVDRGPCAHICRESAKTTKQLLEAIGDQEFRCKVSKNKNVIKIETTAVTRTYHFEFRGSQGNTGNTVYPAASLPGGEGADGMSGIGIFVSPSAQSKSS